MSTVKRDPSNTPGAIETASGRYIDPLNPSRGAVVLDDIAHHLAQINRFSGAARRPMSVAEHTILVADRLRSHGHGAKTILAGLHHDDAEAYLGDICRPVKSALRDIYGPAEDCALRIIWAALSLPDDGTVDWRAIKDADNWALAAEAYHLLPSRGEGWRDAAEYDPDDPHNPPQESRLPFDGWSWLTAKKVWLAQHEFYATNASQATVWQGTTA
jgi:hypothetical protein